MRLLIIDDEEDYVSALARGLRRQGYAVDVALDGEQGYELAQVNDYDLLILDVNLPGMDGFEICRNLRATQPSLLILMLTARVEPTDRVSGLDLGADDYLVKPFHLEELNARVRALLRRDVRARSPLLKCGGLTLDPASRLACLRSRKLDLTTKEFAILEYLMRRQGDVVSHQELLEHAWDGSATAFTNVVRVHITALRHKLQDDPEHPRYLETVIGKGYRMVAPCSEDQPT